MQEFLRQAGIALDYQREMLIGALILIRTMPMIMLTPYLAGKLAPTEVKMGLGLMLTMLLWPLARLTVGDDLPLTAIPFLMLMLKELFVGLAIGFVNAHVFWAVEMAGRMIDTVRGASMAEVMVPESGTRATPVGDLFYQLLIVIFMALDGHHVFIQAYFYSFAKIPLQSYIPMGADLGPFIDFTIRLTGELLLASLVLSAPVVAATFITDVVFGILNRVAPQLNAYFMSMPVKAMAGIILILIAVDPFVARLKDHIVWSLQTMEQTIDYLSVRPR
ncbi:MAG: flagellar biosynthetic protein FliR [Deltaproteobacteria bacterium]|nr:flagellar biosynthetic protein FliR [Deltaproteobacteria bacterium]